MEMPKCRNAVKFSDHESDMRLIGEQSDAWVFQCKRCELVQVISKDGVQDKSKFELAAKRKAEAEEVRRRWEKRKRIFA